jgi:FkbM family methyltransferase
MKTRPGTSDHAIVINMIEGNEYDLPDQMRDWVVVDVGAHIGAFAKACLDRGARWVFCIEPDPENFRLLVENMIDYDGQVGFCSLPAWGRPILLQMTEYDRFDNGEINTGGSQGWLAGPVKYQVPAMSLDQILETVYQAERRIDLVKLDCEGAEWSILRMSVLLGMAEMIVGEFHCNFSGVESFGANELRHFLQKNGFNALEIKMIGKSAVNPEIELGLFKAEKS